MANPRQLLVIPMLAAAAGFGLAPSARAQQVFVSAETIQVVERGAFIDAQFRIRVTNRESTVASELYVELEDGSQVYFGDVPASGSAVSAPQTRTIDISTRPTHNVPVAALVGFALDGEGVELIRTLVVRRSAP